MKNTNSTIHFILTGGTIDSHYDGTKDTAVPNKESVIPNYVSSLKFYKKHQFTTVCMKDSRDLNNSDIKKILKAIENSKHKNIIITHGTYTMPDTARYLGKNLKRTDQKIIFTGSMIPMSGFTNSDGPFNLGFAIAKIEDLDPGIYVCMNGKVFTPDEVRKDLKQGRFTSIFRG